MFKELATEAQCAIHRQKLVDEVLEEIIVLVEKPNDQGVRARILAWLIANDRLEVRFAFPSHIYIAGLFHEKIGVFDFLTGEQVAFTGSANETLGGHRLNYESIDVYRSWIPEDRERVQTKADQFDEAWNGRAAGLEVQTPTVEVVSRLKAHAPQQLPKGIPSARQPDEIEDSRWRHQGEAVETFLNKSAGVLEMATGTGKTRTTLKILDRLIRNGSIEAAIIAMDGTDLLDQWSSELDAWMFESGHRWLIYRHFERHNELREFVLDPQNALLIISREQLHKVVPSLSTEQTRRMIIVHDEVHGLGVPSQMRAMQGEHQKFPWRLGLSATPERAYGAEGNEFLQREIGPTICSFPLERAIERGVLSEFDYIPLSYELTKQDRKRLRDVYAKQAARAREGNPMSQAEVWIELSRVYKTAEMKPQVFRSFLSEHPNILKNCIIFVETKEYGNSLLEDIHNHTTRYRTYYAEDDRKHLAQFSRGEIECLITCHRISQGIDIPSLRAVVLFASARSKLETIQRIGRCLRTDSASPNKRAEVIDFVRPPSTDEKFLNADQERCSWLTALSKIRRVHHD